MSHPVEVIAYHGWGFERSCWADWQRLFASCQIPFTAVDRGYFGNGSMPATVHTSFVANDAPLEKTALQRFTILLVHSYGLHLCPTEQLKQADMLIIFSSFVNFHPQIERKKRRSQRVLQQMLQEFQQHPDKVLNTFKIRCGYSSNSQASISNYFNHVLLTQDLQRLNTSNLNIENFEAISNIIVFHGTADQIVSVTQGEELYQQLKNKTKAITQYVEVGGAEHILPFTHAQMCWDVLSSKLNDVFNICN